MSLVVLAGCGSSGTDVGASSVSGPGGQGGNLKQLVGIDVGVNTSQGWLALPLGKSTADQKRFAENLRGRTVQAPSAESVRARGTGPLVQFAGNAFFRLEGESEPYQGMVPSGNHGGVQFGSAFPLHPEGDVLYRWTLPPGNAGIILQPSDQTQFTELSVAQGPVELNVHYTHRVADEPGIPANRWKITITLNGEAVYDTGEEELATGFAEGSSNPIFPFAVSFQGGSGQYQLERIVAGEPWDGARYQLRGMAFASAFPNVETNPGQPIHVLNSFDWDDGSGIADDHPQWRAHIQDRIGGSFQQSLPQRDGNEIQFSWDPQELVLAKGGGVSMRSPGDPPVYTYSVTAQADSCYEGKRYERSEGGLFPGKRFIRLEPRFDEKQTFNPADGETLHFQSLIFAIGFDDPEPDWVIDVKNAAGQVVRSFHPDPGTDTDDYSPSVTWDGRDAQNEIVPSGQYTFELTASVCEGGGTGSGTTGGPIFGKGSAEAVRMLQSGSQCQVATASSTHGANSERVRIENLKPSAEEFSPSEGESVNVTADVVALGYQQPTGSYNMTFTEANSTVVKSSTGQLAFQGSRAAVNVTWDGKTTAGNVVEPGNYTIDLSVTVTDGAGGEPKTAQKFAEVALGGFILEVRHGSKPIATSTEGQNQLKLLREVLIESSPVVTLVVRGLASRPEPELQADIQTETSGVRQPIVLRKQPDKTYQANLTLGSTWIRQGAISSSATGSSPKPDFSDMLKAFGAPIPNLGLCAKTTGGFGIAFKETARVAPENVRAGGFEHVAVAVNTQAGVTERAEARFKVRHQARTWLWYGHGSLDGWVNFSDEGGPSARPFDDAKDVMPGVNFNIRDLVTVGDRPAVQSIIFTGCNVMDLYDLNNNHSDPNDPRSARKTPGLKWYSATGGKVDLLGYASGSLGPEVLPTLEGFRKNASLGPALAWMKASLEQHDLNSIRAASFDDRNYYYIPFDRDELGQPLLNTARRVYKVRRADPNLWFSGVGWRYPPPSRIAVPTNIKLGTRR